MTKFVTAARLSDAIDRLSQSKAKPRLLDFLVFRRSLTLNGQEALPLSKNNPHLIRAVNEFLSFDPSVSRAVKQGSRSFFNPLSAKYSNRGYKSNDYYSNGVSDTIAGGPLREMISITGNNPRVASLKPDYLKNLDEVVFDSSNGSLPRIDDIALWYFRDFDLDPIVSPTSSPTDAIKQVTDRFISEVGLDAAEESILFQQIDITGYSDFSWVSNLLADHAVYLPPLPTTAKSSARAAPRRGAVKTPPTTFTCSLDLVVSLAAKGFVILSGPSGTGKSRGGLQLAAALEASTSMDDLHALVPVGADWTDARPLLGYKNPFGVLRSRPDKSTTNETYEVPVALKLLLRAAHPDRLDFPHLLLLDEMNLSHVERYFSPFLSLMEAARAPGSGDTPLLSLETVTLISEVLDAVNPTSVEAVAARHLVDKGVGLPMTSNVFILGSINVDETTYMFSPKVLDRAQVIEMLSAPPSVYLSGTGMPEAVVAVKTALAVLQSAGHDIPAGLPNQVFRDQSVDLGFDPSWAADVAQRTEILLNGAYQLLEPVGFAFGYRLINEVFHYLDTWTLARKLQNEADGVTLTSDGWTDALDKVFAQKVLPKIHGNRRQLGESLSALAAFLAGGDDSSSPPAKYRLGGTEDVGIAPANALNLGISDQMPRSRRKLERMIRRLVATNYTTFVE